MTKDPGRKGRRRSPRPTPIDEDLVELATVLAEHQLDNNAYGWFRLPWRNGENAIGLARSAAVTFMGEVELEISNLDEILYILNARRTNDLYERAGKLYRELIQPKINTNFARLLAAALRCLQLKIANSHGGGHAYNEVLISAFVPIEPATVEVHVHTWRCIDAIGLQPQLRGDVHDRQRAAFTIAWKRGLYLAAYSIKPS